MALPTRVLGKTGVHLSVLGLGGEGVLRTYGREREAGEVIRRALAAGVTYFESARAYAGSEAYLGRFLGADRKRVFLATKTHYRSARGAQAHLEESLDALRTDWIDLWYLHDLRTRKDLEEISELGGALETAEAARAEGRVRYLGISGHESPDILSQALDLYPFDVVLMPVNPAEVFVDAFSTRVLPGVRERGLGLVAMKTLCRGLVSRLTGFTSTAPFLQYALSIPEVAVLSVGCDDPEQLEQNVAAVESCHTLPEAQRDTLEQLVYAHHASGLLYYRPPPSR